MLVLLVHDWAMACIGLGSGLFISLCMGHTMNQDCSAEGENFLDFVGSMALRFISYTCNYIYVGAVVGYEDSGLRSGE